MTDPPGRCSNCDVCDAGDAAPEADDLAGTGLTIDARVRHARWGDGVVQHGDPERVTVAFHAVGYKTLALEVLRERSDVLRPAA